MKFRTFGFWVAPVGVARHPCATLFVRHPRHPGMWTNQGFSKTINICATRATRATHALKALIYLRFRGGAGVARNKKKLILAPPCGAGGAGGAGVAGGAGGAKREKNKSKTKIKNALRFYIGV